MSYLYDLTELCELVLFAALVISAAAFGLGYYDGVQLLELFNGFIR